MEFDKRKWQPADLRLTVDSVLRGQGADPEMIRTRSPKLVEIAEQALVQARDILQPEVLVVTYSVASVAHDRLELEDGTRISGQVVSDHLVGADQLTAVICTVGPGIDRYAAEVIKEDIVLGLAITGVGSAGVEALANAVCKEIEEEAAEVGLKSTIPLSPGMVNWDVKDGQPLIFDLADPSQIGIDLNPEMFMLPRYSLTMIIGTGEEIDTGKHICDYCGMRESCQYQGKRIAG
jgi:hypothetical protein